MSDAISLASGSLLGIGQVGDDILLAVAFVLLVALLFVVKIRRRR
jgi:hypothetical protein